MKQSHGKSSLDKLHQTKVHDNYIYSQLNYNNSLLAYFTSLQYAESLQTLRSAD
jgi:hypothetical protein